MHNTHATPVVLITGASKRIGAAIARHFHAQGFFVVLHYHTSRVLAERLWQELETARPHASLLVQADITNVMALQQMMASLAERCGRLDVLINNASRFYACPFSETTEAQFDELMDSNLKGLYFLTQAALPLLKAAQGAVVNLLDTQVSLSLPNFSAYFIGKAAAEALTRTLAVELAPSVRVNAVAPGYILWPEEVSLSEAEKEARVNSIPMGRIGTPEEVAQAVYFLATGPHYITGQTLRVDGARAIA